MKYTFTHIDHCTVIVTDAVRTRHFYGTLLGLTEIAPPREFDFLAIWYDLGGSYLHLLVKPLPDTPSPRHFCLRVDDLAAARRDLTSKGLAIADTVKIAAADRFFIADPDGNRIEILQWDRAYDAGKDGAFRV
ncbi:VOC family protein [soil metagenome]